MQRLMVWTETYGIDNTHGIDLNSRYSIGTSESHTYKRAECYPYAGYFPYGLNLTFTKPIWLWSVFQICLSKSTTSVQPAGSKQCVTNICICIHIRKYQSKHSYLYSYLLFFVHPNILVFVFAFFLQQ